MAITLFTRAVLAGRPVTVFGDGSMRRDFTHVEDIVRGVLAALDRARPGFRVYNLGSGAPVDLRALLQGIGDAAGAKPPWSARRCRSRRGRDVRGYRASARGAGVEPTIALREGLSSVVTWVREHP